MKNKNNVPMIFSALVLALSMSACNNIPLPDSGGTNDADTSYTTVSVTESAAEAAVSEKQEENQEEKQEAAPPDERENTGIGIIHPRISSAAKYYIRSEDSKNLVTSSCQKIELTDEEKAKYPRLAKALNRFFSEVSNGYESSYLDMVLDIDAIIAQDEEDDEWEAPEYMLTHNDETEIYLIRSDSVAFSFKKNNYCYFGGTHPYSSEVMCNFDTESGHELYIEDVVTDLEKLNEILYQRLTDEYDGYIDDPADYLEKCRTGEYDYNWLLCHNGVMIHFNTYSLGPYASGYQTIYIGFDEYPGLFEKKYTAAPENYAVRMKGETAVYADIDGDGKADSLRAGGFLNADYMEWTQYISLNDTETSFTIEACTGTESYLVCSGGRYYIYNLCDNLNGRTLYTFDITGGNVNDDMTAKEFLPRGLPEYSQYSEGGSDEDRYTSLKQGGVRGSFTDPTALRLSEKLFAGLMTASKVYYADADGMLRTDDEYYTADDPERSLYITSAPLTADLLDGSGNVSEKGAVIPADTKMTAVRSDGMTYIDFRLDDNREIRVYFTSDGSELKINGRYYSEIIDTRTE